MCHVPSHASKRFTNNYIRNKLLFKIIDQDISFIQSVLSSKQLIVYSPETAALTRRVNDAAQAPGSYTVSLQENEQVL